MTFDPRKHLTQLNGRDYMEVKDRLLWLVEQGTPFAIDTAIVECSEQHAIVRAEVTLYGEGGTVLRRATAHGSAYRAQLRGPIAGRWLEKAETAGLGRALAALGFGTQFAAEYDDGQDEHLADTPVAPAEPDVPGPVAAFFAICRDQGRLSPAEVKRRLGVADIGDDAAALRAACKEMELPVTARGLSFLAQHVLGQPAAAGT